MTVSRKKTLIQIISWTLTAVLLGALARYVWRERETFGALLAVSPVHVAILCCISLTLSSIDALTRKLIIARLGKDLTFADWYGLPMVTNLVSLLVPARGGLLVGAAYLKKKYDLPLAHFASMIYGNAVLLALVLGLEGLLGLLLLGVTRGAWDARVIGIVAALVVMALVLGLLSGRALKGQSWPIRMLREALDGWQMLRSSPRLLATLALLIALNSMVFTGWMYVSYRALGFEVGLLPAFVAGVATQMSFFFTLTPGNLGVREYVVGFVSLTTGLGFAEGVAVTVLQRALSSICFLVVGGAFSLLLYRSLFRAEKAGSAEHTQGTAGE